MSSQEDYVLQYNAFGIRGEAMSPYNTNVPGLSNLMPNTANTPDSPIGQIDGQQTGEISLVSGFLQSSNFVTGSTGWQINSSGDCEFNNGVFRGTITASAINIGSGFHVDINGNVWWGAAATYAAAIIAGANRIGNDGKAVLSDATLGGSLSATSIIANTAGSIGGWVIDGSKIRSPSGLLILEPNGTIYSGQTAYDTGTGWWIEGSATPRFSIGNSAGNKMTWNGSTLGITGDITGSTITGGIVRTSNSSTRVELNNSGDQLTVYSSGNKTISISGAAVALYDSVGVFAGNLTGFGPANTVQLSGGGFSHININSTIVEVTANTLNPSDNGGTDLGTSSSTWREGFINKISGNGGANVLDFGNSGYLATNQSIKLVNSGSDPGISQAGALYYNSSTNKLKFYDGGTWRTVTST